MKKTTILSAVAGLAIGATAAMAGSTPGSGIVGSKHDMNLQTGNGATADQKGRVCAFCHTPHHKLDAADLDYNPLWSHEIATGTYIAYGEKTKSFDATVGADPLSGPSRLCMSCHDGVIAVDQHYGIGGTATGSHLQGDDFGQVAVGLGKDLSNDHPIGFMIEDALAKDGASLDRGITAFGNALNAVLVTSNTKFKSKNMTDLGYKFSANQSLFTCASCHEVHNKDNNEEAFLYDKQAGSAFCLMCHAK